MDEKIYPRISAAVATYALAYDRTLTWEQMDTKFAAVANLTSSLEPAKRAFTDRQKEIANTHEEVLRANTWEFVLGKPANFYRLGTASDWADIVKSMGATLGNASQVDFFGPLLSFEQIDLLSDATVIITSPRPGSDALLALPAWATLPAARAGHVYTAKNVNSYTGAGELLDLVDRICKELKAGNG